VKLKVDNIWFSYNSAPVLDKVTFKLGCGEVLAVVGPNGSGKSTLLKCIDQILKPKSGVIRIEGKKINDYSNEDVAKKMGYVPQSNGKSFPSTVFDTILLGRKPHIRWGPTSTDFNIVSKVINSLKLEDLTLRDINELSGGQRQKVIIGRALAQEPSILLLDEPTANLDLKHQLEVLKLVREQANKGVSAIIAIHDLNLALRYSDKILMLDKGKVFAAGGLDVLTPENIESVYDVKVRVVKDNGRILVIPEEPNGDDHDRSKKNWSS
jgi:iron complex transport system ATP-binding protein